MYRRVIIGLIIAWLSHILLDTFYVDSHLAVFWPFSQTAVSRPGPWLNTLPPVPPPFDVQVLRVFLFETLTFLPLLVLAVVVRQRTAKARVPYDLRR
jgi:membrane-bound metal-dependent hydrolase YbcI (DUF457 family)